MAKRKDFFEALRGLEGGEKLESMAEGLFKEVDAEAKSYREKAAGLEEKQMSFVEEMESLKSKAKKADELSNKNNDFASQMELLTKQVGVLTDANTELSRKEKALVQEKKDNNIKSFFTDAVSSLFGSDGARIAFNDAVATGSIDATGEDVLYKGKLGDEALEMFKSDYSSRFTKNNGTGTSGGMGKPSPMNSLDGVSVEDLLANGGALLKK